VEKLRAEFEIDIVIRHFPLHPDTPENGLTLESLFAGRGVDIPDMQARMTRLMAEEGLPYGERTMTYNSRLAQELAKWVETQTSGGGIHDALYRAYFVENVNLAKIDNLIKIAERVGLPDEKTREVLEKRQFRGAVDADWQRSRVLGITGVPAFVIGDRGLTGAQPFEQLAGLVSSAGAARRESWPGSAPE
jgi:predicted DsbA family dithiol-disulfide isomerase